MCCVFICVLYMCACVDGCVYIHTCVRVCLSLANLYMKHARTVWHSEVGFNFAEELVCHNKDPKGAGNCHGKLQSVFYLLFCFFPPTLLYCDCTVASWFQCIDSNSIALAWLLCVCFTYYARVYVLINSWLLWVMYIF